MKTATLFCFITMAPYLTMGCNVDVLTSSDDEVNIPQIVNENLSALIPQIKAHQSESSVSFVYISDLHNQVHTGTYSFANENIQKIQRLVMAVNEINKKVGLCCVVLGGDYLWNTTHTTKTAAIEALTDFCQAMTRINDLPILCLKGNHDDNSLAGVQNTLTQEEYYDICATSFISNNIVTDSSNPSGCYGYFDCLSQKTRFLYINSVDLPWIEIEGDLKYKIQWQKGIRQPQLDFIAKALTFEEKGWGVIFISHHSVKSIVGYDTSSDSYITPANGGDQLYGIIKAYKNGSIYYGRSNGDFESQVAVDYSTNKDSELICLLNGHIHCDRNAIYDGMLFCSTTSATLGNGKSYNTNNSIYNPTSNTVNETAFDVITVDRKIGTVYFDRFGFGESREFRYK